MTDTLQELGLCPVCTTALVRNRHDRPRDRSFTVSAVQPPPNAYFPEITLAIHVVWCPACGWVRKLDAPQIGMTWINPGTAQ